MNTYVLYARLLMYTPTPACICQIYNLRKHSTSREAGRWQGKGSIPLRSSNEALISPKARWPCSCQGVPGDVSRLCCCTWLVLWEENTQAAGTLMDRQGLHQSLEIWLHHSWAASLLFFTTSAGSRPCPRSAINHSVNQQESHMMVNYWIVSEQFFMTKKKAQPFGKE